MTKWPRWSPQNQTIPATVAGKEWHGTNLKTLLPIVFFVIVFKVYLLMNNFIKWMTDTGTTCNLHTDCTPLAPWDSKPGNFWLCWRIANYYTTPPRVINIYQKLAQLQQHDLKVQLLQHTEIIFVDNLSPGDVMRSHWLQSTWWQNGEITSVFR